MKATIWHNPKCGTSRKTLAQLEEAPDIELTIIEYLKTAPSRAKLKQLYNDADITPQEGLRVRGSPAEDMGLTDDSATADQILDAMAVEPMLIERPLVETEKGVRLCRPQEKVQEII